MALLDVRYGQVRVCPARARVVRRLYGSTMYNTVVLPHLGSTTTVLMTYNCSIGRIGVPVWVAGCPGVGVLGRIIMLRVYDYVTLETWLGA